jgi:hypothetical protein
MCPEFCDGDVSLARVVGPVGDDACDVLIGTDLARQYGRIAYVAAFDLDRPDLQRLLYDPDVDFAPDAALWRQTCARSARLLLGH